MPHRCTLGCKSTDVPLHIFPNPNKFPDRFKTWVNLVGGKLETPSDYEFYTKQRLCDIHFTIDKKNRFKRLNALAVPSLHLPDVPLHIFPNPNKFPDRFKTWVNLVGGKLETPSDYEFYTKQRLCDIHFTIDKKNRFKRLNALAVPSLHLPEQLHTEPAILPLPSTSGIQNIECDIHMEVAAELKMGKVVTAEAQRFMVDCLKAVGTASKAAEQQAELLIQADRFGHPSHGLNRLEMYVNDIKAGACEPNNEPKVLKETDATAWVDANNVLGATASHFGMDLAIKKALKTGVGWVAVKGSNHYGMAGFWAQKAADQGLIGMAYTNTSPLLAPTRSKKAALGTNPIACVAPASQNESFYLDMATTTVSLGKIEMQRRKGESLPPGWAQGPDGKDTKDAELAFKTRCLMPIGGTELTSGYKGFGLAAMVELFCGVLSGSKYGHHVRAWSHSGAGGPADLGHCFIAVNPDCFAPCFGDRLADCITHWRQMEPTDPKLPVLAPGDKEKQAAAETDARGYVTFVKQQIAASAALAKRLKIKPMEVEMDK